MKGKIGLVVGLGAGYVLGTRAGRERYEQIRTQWLKVWNLDPVQEQVQKVSTFARSQISAVPVALWHGAVKVVKSTTGDGSPGQKLDSVIASGKETVEEVQEAADDKPSSSSSSSSTKSTSTGGSISKSSSSKSSTSKSTAAKKTSSSGTARKPQSGK
ncbi:MAG: hypothetical protein ACQEW8_14340 [Actinomycetota bacterium]